MGSVFSRDRTIEDPVEVSLYSGSANGADVLAGAREIGQAALLIPRRSGHTYDNSSVEGSSRAHFGDVYNQTVNLGPSDSRDEPKISRSHKDFMSTLTFHQMSFRESAIDPAYVETSRWVLETAKFRQWRDRKLDSDSNIFWLKGKPGTGKSTIMKTILKHLEDKDPKSIVLSFFFNARGQSLEQSIEGLYRTMLHQLFSRVPSLLATTKTEQTYAHKPTWTTEMLRGLFSDAVLGLRQERVILVVDALDEGDEQEVRSMLESARNLARSAHTNKVSLGICLASRHYPNITMPGCQEVVVEEQAKHDEDIARYIRGTLILDYEPRSYNFAEAIARRARGVFLWVTLVVGLLNERYDHGATQDELIIALKTTPPGLKDLLRTITSSGKSDKRLLPALLWIFCNVGAALNVREFYVAIQVGAGIHDESLNHGNLRDMHRYIISASRGLVEFVPKGYLQQACRYAGNANSGIQPSQKFEDACCIVQFIHESVREHLLSGGLAELCSELSPDVEGRGHAMLAEWYQAYMRSFSPTLTPFPTCPGPGIMIDVGQISHEDMEKFRSSNTFAFFQRALISTFQHVRIAHFRDQLYPMDLQGFPVMQWANMKNVEYMVHADDWQDLPPPLWHGHESLRKRPRFYTFQPTLSLLYVLLSERCEDLAMSLCVHFPAVLTSYKLDQTNLEFENVSAGPQPSPLASESLEKVCGGYYGSTLGAAVGTSSKDMIKLLLHCGADINNDAAMVGSPLEIAIRNRDLRIVKLLLSECPYIGAPRSVSFAYLSTAVDMCDAEILGTLLAHGVGANILVRPWYSHHLFWRAAYLGLPDICQLLINRGVIIDANALSSLWAAAVTETAGLKSKQKKEQILKLMADHSDTRSNIEGLAKALLIVIGPYSECRKLCFDYKDGDDMGEDGDDGKDVEDGGCEEHEDQSSGFRCELHGLMSPVCAESVFPNKNTPAAMRTLLEFGADPNAIGGYFETPLIAAAIMGQELYVKILLEFGADIYYSSEIYGTAAEAALEMGWDNIVTLLLEAEEADDSASEQGEDDLTVSKTSNAGAI